uniref:Glycosyltransferase 2-like domain-containing protein n=1 Tax=Caldiarchaeum subterraneum TaxID=311458 RepID=E6NA36_CALS0|nr:hypothetical protein HGMM_F51A06C35 [Candidatus Caldarchaeum subterraneum]
MENEIIVVDNGSTDKTTSIIAEYAAKHSDKIKLIKLNRNYGPGAARNIGAQAAKHDILFFLDADMVFPPDFILKMAKHILEGKTVSTAHGEEIIRNVDNPWVKAQGQLKKNIPKHTSEIIRAIRKDVFLSYGGFDPSLNYHDDRTFHYKTGIKAEVVPDAVCYHNNPDTAAEILRRNYWIGRTFIAVTIQEHGLRGLATVAKTLTLRMLDLTALPLLITYIALRWMGVSNPLQDILLLAPALLFTLSTAKMKILKASTPLESIKLRLFYAPAYRVLRAAGLIAGVAASLVKGLKWSAGIHSIEQPPNQAPPKQ